MENKYFDSDMVDATYITEDGSTFDDKAPWPHENFVTLRWEHSDDEDTVIEFVYFGSHKNRLVYHAVKIDEKSVLTL